MKHYQVGNLSFQLDFSLPLYEQILQQIRYAIAKEELGIGSRIPSVRELAMALKINPNTVMRAYQELERDGLTEKRRGKGTFVTADAEQVQTFRQELFQKHVRDFLHQLDSLGVTWTEAKQMIDREKEGEV